MSPEFSTPTASIREFIASSRSSRTGPSEDRLFNQLALELFAVQFKHNEPYRRFCEFRGVTPGQPGGWASIPALPAAAFKEHEVSCLPAGRRTAEFRSSGTTSCRPSRHFHGTDSLALYEASLWRWFAAHLMPEPMCGPPFPRLLILSPPHLEAPRSSLVYMFDAVRRQVGAAPDSFVGRAGGGAWVLDAAAADWALRRSEEAAEPLLLLGTAFTFLHLLDSLAERKLRYDLPPGSRVMETGGYKGRSRSLPKVELHSLITARLGVPATHIVSEYGMSELSSQAYDRRVPERVSGKSPAASDAREPERVFQFPPWARAQVVNPETGAEACEGETGLLRVFDLANVHSVMAIQTEDLAVRRGGGFELIGRHVAAEPRGCSLLAQ